MEGNGENAKLLTSSPKRNGPAFAAGIIIIINRIWIQDAIIPIGYLLPSHQKLLVCNVLNHFVFQMMA